jgi:hypothetical protein
VPRRSGGNLAITDLRVDRKESERVLPSSANLWSKSFPASGRARRNPPPDDGTEIHRPRRTSTGPCTSPRRLVGDREHGVGPALTQFEADANVARPNYAGSNNEREALRDAFEKALQRTAAGLRNLPEVP